MTRRFSSGVPAIADEDMSEWMKYVYMQFERPADAEGVTVILCAIDPNGNYMDIERTTSDAYGNWALSFNPEMEGTYQIIATFEGSGAYYGSTSTTYMSVDPAPAVSAPIEPEEPKPEVPVEPSETVETPFYHNRNSHNRSCCSCSSYWCSGILCPKNAKIIHHFSSLLFLGVKSIC